MRGKKERYHLNNRVGALFVKLPVGSKTIKRRLELCKFRMDMMKLSPAVPIAMLFIRMTTKLLSNQLCRRLQYTYSAKASLIFSNGPPRGLFSPLNCRHIDTTTTPPSP